MLNSVGIQKSHCPGTKASFGLFEVKANPVQIKALKTILSEKAEQKGSEVAEKYDLDLVQKCNCQRALKPLGGEDNQKIRVGISDTTIRNFSEDEDLDLKDASEVQKIRNAVSELIKYEIALNQRLQGQKGVKVENIVSEKNLPQSMDRYLPLPKPPIHTTLKQFDPMKLAIEEDVFRRAIKDL